MLVCPEREGDRGEVIDEGDGVAVFGQVDRSEEKLAGVAGFHADVGQLLRDVNWLLALGFFATR